MKNTLITIAFILVTAFLFSSCQKNNIDIDPQPQIVLKEVQPVVVKQFQDSIVIILEYKDGDGDLGFIEADSFSLKVHDSRLRNPDWYHIAPLAPVGEAIAIKGTLKFILKGIFLLGNGGQETTTFSIRLKDRANNWSNEVITPTITIVP